ncbi:unnamed protein product, partial [Gulo gulo]
CPRRAVGPCPIHQRPNERPRRSWLAHSRSSLCLVKPPTWSPEEQERGGELMLVVPAVPGKWTSCLGPSYYPLGPDAHSRVSSRQLAGIWGLLVTPDTWAGGRQSVPLLRALCTIGGRSEGSLRSGEASTQTRALVSTSVLQPRGDTMTWLSAVTSGCPRALGCVPSHVHAPGSCGPQLGGSESSHGGCC